MKLIVSSDKLTAVNADMVKRFYIYIGSSDAFVVCADEICLCYHKDIKKARKEFDDLITHICRCEESCVYNMEDTN